MYYMHREMLLLVSVGRKLLMSTINFATTYRFRQKQLHYCHCWSHQSLTTCKIDQEKLQEK